VRGENALQLNYFLSTPTRIRHCEVHGEGTATAALHRANIQLMVRVAMGVLLAVLGSGPVLGANGSGGGVVELPSSRLLLGAVTSPAPPVADARAKAAQRDYGFETTISRPELENYLSRSITYSDLLHGLGNVEDNIRFLTNCGAKFIGRAIYRWGSESQLPELLAKAKPIAEKAHAADPDMILQAACFEIVTRQVSQLPVPEWLFKEFGLPPETRNFQYESMLYPEGQWGRDHWGKGASVPDMSQRETQMWFVYLAASYIDLGVEAIHFGQVEIMDRRDKMHTHWREMLGRVRGHATRHARRRLLLCDAHVPSGGIVHEGKLMLDFHSFPLRIDEVPDKPEEGVLKMGYLDSLFGRSKGGLTPSGWSCDHLPFIVELDNFGASGHGGENIGAHWIWGYDEICWFARQPEGYRNQWLRYAWNWVREHDANGYLQMPGSRTLAVPAGGKHWYWANAASPATPNGYGQEETIKAIWGAH
jgi:hypothetical protein